MTGIGTFPEHRHIDEFLNPDGSLRWSQTWDSVASGADQSRAITKSASGIIYVAGNTPGPNFYANILVLGYDAATGALLKTIQYSSGNFSPSLPVRLSRIRSVTSTSPAGRSAMAPDVIPVKFDPTGKVYGSAPGTAVQSRLTRSITR